ncbi:MAG: zinc-ribbon and DUF3426 domain-containing protein [Alcanivoracaceae bacterium]|nr:zinc-ribbon and DUF3426 domain-containing protein [Alcanivoracaceae bacterium]
MFTQCRGCGEVFRVVVDDLVTASAMVRCSTCGTVFNSLNTLSEYKPQESADLILHENDNPPPLLTHEFKQSVITKPLPRQVVVARIKTPEKRKKEILAERPEELLAIKPGFVTDRESKVSKKSSVLWVLFTLLLLTAFGWQASEAIKRGSLHLPEGRLKQEVCAQIECYVGVEHSNLNKIALVSRSIRQHPGRDNALIITTGIINSDENVQLFPALQVKMSNLNGEIVAMRRFLPNEYIGEEIIKVGMLPNTLIPVTLELQSPGKNAVTFEVGFSSTYGAK